MAQTQDIGVSRAVFSSALLRSDHTAPDISRDDATFFARSLLRTCNICTTGNIKLCKSFIVRSILPSANRTAALMKYLLALSKSFSPRDPEARVDTTKPGDENEGLGKIVNGKVQQPPEPGFKRLHIVYLVHDLLVYITHHQHTRALPDQLKDQLYPEVCALAELAVCSSGSNTSPTLPIMQDLLSLWTRSQIFPPAQLSDLRHRIDQASGADWQTTLSHLAQADSSKTDTNHSHQDDSSKWILPDRHGVPNDPTAPWHELPAANGLYLRRKHGYPLRASAIPAGGIPLQRGGAEANPDLKRDVLNLYNEVLRCYDKYTDPEEVQDVDALGNIIWKNVERPTRNYWGFTLDGVERKKELARRFEEGATGYGGQGGKEDAVERARMLAAGRGRGMGMGGRGMGVGGRGMGIDGGDGYAERGWRGGRGW